MSRPTTLRTVDVRKGDWKRYQSLSPRWPENPGAVAGRAWSLGPAAAPSRSRAGPVSAGGADRRSRRRWSCPQPCRAFRQAALRPCRSGPEAPCEQHNHHRYGAQRGIGQAPFAASTDPCGTLCATWTPGPGRARTCTQRDALAGGGAGGVGVGRATMSNRPGDRRIGAATSDAPDPGGRGPARPGRIREPAPVGRVSRRPQADRAPRRRAQVGGSRQPAESDPWRRARPGRPRQH